MKQLSCLLLLCLFAGALCKGTLYLNRITGNVDPITGYSPVYVECVTFTHDEIILDFINGLQGDGTGYGAGTYVEGSNNNRGSLTIPGNLHVNQTGTVDGWVYANGGIFCDDQDYAGDDTDDITYQNLFDDDDTRILKNDDDALDDDVFDYSFTVDDNTGITTVNGIIYPNGGIKVGDDLFTVQDDTGRTEVKGLTRPDGGIVVSIDDDFIFWSVRTDGYLFSAGNISVEHDFYLGSDKSETRFFERMLFNSQGDSTIQGGSTTFHGQDAGEIGGNLVLIPGFGTGEFGFHENGAIYLGRIGKQGDFLLQRQLLDENYANNEYPIDGGDFIFSAQDSSANGGDLRIAAGDATDGYTGGDIVLATGLGSTIVNVDGDSDNGDIILGPRGFSPDYGQRLNFDLHVTRPPITDASDAGDTIILGQLSRTEDTKGGDLSFVAGFNLSPNTGSVGGNLYLQPGETHSSALLAAQEQGVIYLGGFENNFDLLITRLDGNDLSGGASAGDLHISGQSSLNGDGGDLILLSGGGGSEVAENSILHLQTGYGVTGGSIIWDTQPVEANFPDDLYIKRDPIASAGRFTHILGQTADNAASGGNLLVNAGSGFTFGGSINIFGGKGHGSNGGAIEVLAGGGVNGGDIEITAGGAASTIRNGGSITIWPGNGNPSSIGQNLIFSAGSNTATPFREENGDIEFLSRQINVHVPFVLDQNANRFGENRFQIGNSGGLKLSAQNPNGLTNPGFFSFGPLAGETSFIRPRLNFSNKVREPVNVPQENGVAATNELNDIITEIYNGLRYHNLFLAP